MLSVNGNGASKDNGHHFTAQNPAYLELKRVVSSVKEAYMSSGWGAKGLSSFIPEPAKAAVAAPERFAHLSKLVDETLKVMEAFVASKDPSPGHAAYFLRNTVFSDALCISLYIVDEINAKGNTSAAKLPRFEEVVKDLTERMSPSLIAELELRDDEDLVDWIKKVAGDITDLDPESLHFSTHRMAATSSHLKLMGDIALNKNLNLRSTLSSWTKEREKDRQNASRLIEELKHPPSLKVKDLSLPRIPAEEIEQPLSAPPPKVSAPSKPVIELPKGSLMEDIDGIDEIGENDTRRDPVRSGNKTVAKPKDEKTLRREAKESERLEKMKKAGIRPDNEIGKSKHQMKREQEWRKKK